MSKEPFNPDDVNLTQNRVLIHVDAPPKQSKAGIFITETWKTLPPTGTVKAIGPDVTTVEIGDRVVFERYASIQLSDLERICIEPHILAKITDG